MSGDKYDWTGETAGTGVIVVSNIRVGLVKGTYTLTIRAFDIVGNSVSVSYKLTVEEQAGETVIVSSAPPVATVGQTSQTYTLKNEFGIEVGADIDSGRAYMVRKIKGPGNFALMGSEFTSFAQGQFFFEEGYYVKDAKDAADDKYRQAQGLYDFRVDDTLETAFEVQGIMPVYAPKGSDLILPSIVAHNRYANAKIEKPVIRSLKSSTTVNPALITKIETEADLPADIKAATGYNFDNYYNGYMFKPTEDGKYEVTYSASVNNSPAGTKSFTITVGDNIPPTFTVAAVKAFALNEFFKFEVMTVDADSHDVKDGNKYDDIEFIKRLILPSGERYEVSDWGETGRTKTMDSSRTADGGYKLTASGTYRIEYIARDRAGNESIEYQDFEIAGEGSAAPWPWKVFSIVMVIIAVLLIAAVILYLARFQKKKIKA